LLFNSYPWPLGEIIGRAALNGVPSWISDCSSPPWPIDGEGPDNGGTLSNGDGTDDVDGMVGEVVGVDATNGDGEDVIGGSTCLDIKGMLASTSNGGDVVVGTTPPNWVGILTLVGDGDDISAGLGVGIVIFST